MDQKLIIDCRQWLRGDVDNSFLYRRSDGKKCCLGMYLEQQGVPVEALRGRGTPNSLSNPLPASCDWLLSCAKGGNSPAAKDLMAINDATVVDERTRKQSIVGLFAEQGVTVRFINEDEEAA